ncbi:MAG: hypothetical protein EXS36_14505 [Pedosphaera sp.]|nr:hypothetical protein [Pedosphaera sp.]
MASDPQSLALKTFRIVIEHTARIGNEMRILEPRLLATICLTSAFAAIAGSYPPGKPPQEFDVSDGTVDLADGSRIASTAQASNGTPVAVVQGGMLRLVDRGTLNAIGSFKLGDLDPGNIIKGFDLRFGVTMGAGTGLSTGEGWSVNFGRIPNDEGTGEGGFAPLPGGLTIAFDTLDNGEDPTSIEVFIGGVSIAAFPRAFIFDQFSRIVTVHWDSAGLDITYDGNVICTDLATPGFTPGPGNIFAFTARTTSASQDVFLDNLKATTLALPVIETGGPILSEFVANNGDLEDEFADKPGWIELLNGSAIPVDLTGWYLTDSKKSLTKWRINGLILTPYNYQLVFASGRDRQLYVTSFIHAGFSLAKSGGFVALVRPDGKTIASSYDYGPQQKNVAFGEKGSERKKGYMYPATPGTVNAQEPAAASFSPEVEYSHQGSFIPAPIALTLSAPNPTGSEIRYTLDRTEPGPTSTLYTRPIEIAAFTTVRARVYAPDHLPGRVSSRTFVLMDETLAQYAGTGKALDSNLPLIFVDSYGVNVDGSTGGTRPFRPTYAVVIPPDPQTGRASLNSVPEYAGPAGIHVRGESSRDFDQRSYSLELWDEAGKDQGARLLGMSDDSDWILYAPWSEKTLMRNKLIFDWMLALRGPDGSAVRTRFVELFFNQSKPPSGRVGYSSYRGIYVLMEKLKRGKERVPIQNLNTNTIDPQLITGGYIIRKDKDDALKNNWTSAKFGIALQSFDPDRLNGPQLAYIRTYVNTFESALNSANYRTFTNGYQAYIDPDTFIDAQWMLEVGKQVDGYVFSTYWYKDRAGRLRAGPLWDFNISLGNADYATGDTPTGWLYDSANGVGQLWYPRLHSDPDYKLAHWDRYWEMRRSILATATVMATIDGHMHTLLDGYTGAVSNSAPAEIQNPIARHFRKWPRLGKRDWPNPPGETKIRTWQAEVDYMKNWIKPRLEWLDDQSLRSGQVTYRPPEFSHAGGPIGSAIQLTIKAYHRAASGTTFPDGDIYYTLDNSDPRLAGGNIGGSATKYTQPLDIGSSVTVNARLYVKKQWSPLETSTFLLRALPARSTNLVISEILFKPAPVSPAEIAGGVVDLDSFEYLELRNIARQAIDLNGVKFTRGVEFDFTFAPPWARLLKPGESVVLAADKRALLLRYPHLSNTKIIGRFSGHIDNSGETLALEAANGELISQFRYENSVPWPPAGDGAGRSLVLKNPPTHPNPDDPTHWIQSAKTGGTPGESGIGADVFLGDLAADSDGDGLTDFFEFASGSDPENPSSRYFPSTRIAPLLVDGTESNYFTFSYQRRPTAAGLIFSLEMSGDLKAWIPSDSNLTLLRSDENRDGTFIETYRGTTPVLNSPEISRFYRLRVRPQ